MINALKLAVFTAVVATLLACGATTSQTDNGKTENGNSEGGASASQSGSDSKAATVSKFDVALAKDVQAGTTALVAASPGANQIEALKTAVNEAEAGVSNTGDTDTTLEIWLHSDSTDYNTYFTAATGAVKSGFEVEWDSYAAGSNTKATLKDTDATAKDAKVQMLDSITGSARKDRTKIKVGKDLLTSGSSAKKVVVVLRAYTKGDTNKTTLQEWTLTLSKATELNLDRLNTKLLKASMAFGADLAAATQFNSKDIGAFNAQGLIAAENAAGATKTGANNPAAKIKDFQIWSAGSGSAQDKTLTVIAITAAADASASLALESNPTPKGVDILLIKADISDAGKIVTSTTRFTATIQDQYGQTVTTGGISILFHAA